MKTNPLVLPIRVNNALFVGFQNHAQPLKMGGVGVWLNISKVKPDQMTYHLKGLLKKMIPGDTITFDLNPIEKLRLFEVWLPLWAVPQVSILHNWSNGRKLATYRKVKPISNSKYYCHLLGWQDWKIEWIRACSKRSLSVVPATKSWPYTDLSDESTQSVLDVLCSMIREGELFVPHDQSKDRTLITRESNVWTVYVGDWLV